MSKEMTTSAVLTQATFDPNEVWEVSTGKEKFTLNGKQAQLVKDATLAGQRGLIFFDGFAISIPHIVSMVRRSDAADFMSKQALLSRVKQKEMELNIY